VTSESSYLTIQDIVRRLAVNRKTVEGWLHRGELKGIKLGSKGRLWRVSEESLREFMKGQGQQK